MDSIFDRTDWRQATSIRNEDAVLHSSIDCSGRPCRQTLVVAQEHLARHTMAEKGDGNPAECRWSRADIHAFRIEEAVGSSFLQAKLDGHWDDLIRSPKGETAKLRRFSTRLEQWLASGKWPTPDGDLRLPGAEDATEPKAGHTRRLLPLWQLWRRSRGDPSSSVATPSGRQIARVLIVTLRPFRRQAIVLVVLSLAAVGIELVPPMLQKVLVDEVLDVEHSANRMPDILLLLLAIVIGLASIRLASTVVTIWKGYLGSVVGTSLTADLRSRLVAKLHHMPLSFYDRHQVGALMSRVAYDTETMHALLHHLTSGCLLQVLQLVGIGVMLLYLNPKLAAITMLPTPLILLGSWYFTRYLYPRHHRYWEAVGKQAAGLTGMLSGIRVVKSFVQEDREWRRFCRSSQVLRDSRQTVDNTTVAFTALMGFLFSLGGLAVWYVGGRDILADRMTLGALMAFLAYLAMFYAPLTSLAEAVSWFSSFLSASHRIFGLLESTEEEFEPANPKQIVPLRGAIDFEDVSFGYDRDQTTLDGVQFRIQPGQTVGIVGPSGSGKSTLVNLIGRLYEVRSGRICIDGTDIRDLDARQLRGNIGIVPQEPFLFAGSVAENIAYGRPDASPFEILAAAGNADAHDFIMRLPYGYDTRLGEGGCGLSGGERQRLSIARALILNPPILIFDEATSSVDALAEASILRAVRRVTRGRTTIVVAHRLSTIRDADHLLVFERGRLVEQGTHDTLVESGGLYRSLVDIQIGPGRRRHARTADTNRCDADGHGRPFWLDCVSTRVEALPAGRLTVSNGHGEYDNVHALRAFPARCGDEFLSLQHRDAVGREQEIGMIRNISEWPTDARSHLKASLDRRYLLRDVLSIRKVCYVNERLQMVVDTDCGEAQAEVARPEENVQPYGPRGILLTATDGRLYVIADCYRLPAKQRRNLATFLGGQ